MVPLPSLTTDEAISKQDWAIILQAKEAINKVIEEQRVQGVVKGSWKQIFKYLPISLFMILWLNWVTSYVL